MIRCSFRQAIGRTCHTKRVSHLRTRGLHRSYCKRPIQCRASSKILTPHRPASVYPPALGAGGGHTRWVEKGWGFNILEDARHCSVLYIRNYFVGFTQVNNMWLPFIFWNNGKFTVLTRVRFSFDQFWLLKEVAKSIINLYIFPTKLLAKFLVVQRIFRGCKTVRYRTY